jgi:hypothetical protein
MMICSELKFILPVGGVIFDKVVCLFPAHTLHVRHLQQSHNNNYNLSSRLLRAVMTYLIPENDSIELVCFFE